MNLLLRPTTPLIPKTYYGQKTSSTTQGLHEKSQENLSKPNYNGNFSPTSRKRATTVGNYMLEQHKQKMGNYTTRHATLKPCLCFVTLTFPIQMVETHQSIKRKYLNSFLIQLGERYREPRYLWRAELQQNGNIHFHILISKFIHKAWLNYQWYAILRKHGIYQSDLSHAEIQKLPATNIESPKTNRGVANYILKYIAKTNDGKKIQGRQWSSNLPYVAIKNTIINLSYDAGYLLTELRERGLIKCFEMDYCIIIQRGTRDFLTEFFPSYLPLYDDYLTRYG